MGIKVYEEKPKTHVIKIYTDRETFIKWKKMAAEFGSYEKTLKKILEVFERYPDIFRPKFA